MINCNECQRITLQLDGELYRAIKDAYEQEQDADPASAAEKHAQGVMAAIKAVYMIGEAHGYTEGFHEGIKKRGLSDAVRKNGEP